MATQTKETRMRNRWGKTIMQKIFYITKHGISFRQRAHQGAKECARRVAQGRAGECYVHGRQYDGHVE